MMGPRSLMAALLRQLPFAPSTTPLQALAYLLGISLFSISFLVFLNSSVSFVITDLIGQKKRVGDVVGTLGFADELVALMACPAWGMLSDRLGVRWVATMGYAIIGVSLLVFVQARSVYPGLLLARILFAVGASAAATMVTAILPSLTDDSPAAEDDAHARIKALRRTRNSIAFSVESELTITPERYTHSVSTERDSEDPADGGNKSATRTPRLAGLVGLFTGCGALVALVLFLPLPAKFGEIKGVTPAQAISYSFYIVGLIALVVAVFVGVGLRGLKGEEDKGWHVLFGHGDEHEEALRFLPDGSRQRLSPYFRLLKDSVLLGFSDSNIALGYIGGFVARASSVAISLFIPLYVNTYFIERGFCKGSPHDPSPELKEECRTAYVLSSILTGVSQLVALLCAPLFGYLSSRAGRINAPVVVAAALGIVGYAVLPHLASPEIKNVDGRGGSPAIFLVVSLIGISQIGAIVCSLGSLGRGVLAVDVARGPAGAAPGGGGSGRREPTSPLEPDEDESVDEARPLMGVSAELQSASRIQLKGSIAGVYSLCGGAAILILTKLGGYLFDSWFNGAPFYLMALFNAMLLVATLGMNANKVFSRRN